MEGDVLIGDRIAQRSCRSWLRKLERGEFGKVGPPHCAQVRMAVALGLVAFFERLNAS